MKDNLSSQFAMQPDGPVYHGSGHGFAPGDTIDPTPDHTHMGGESAAFGVTNTSTAGYFGLEGARNPREGQGRLFASVYEVGPKSTWELHPAVQKDYDTQVKYRRDYQPMPEAPPNTMPIDREGFEVKRHAAWAYQDPSKMEKGWDIPHELIEETPRGTG